MSIKFIDLERQYHLLKPKIKKRINAVLEHGQYIMGPEVKELEENLALYVGSKYCVTVSSGTDALLVSLLALGVGVGDEVITSPFTFASTVEVIVLLGAIPVYVDVESDTCNFDAKLLDSKITKRTKAIIPVSIFGQPADMDHICSIAERHGGIPVIEDAAQSFGARYKNRKSCNLSLIGCTSFFPSKPLGCYGDGGAIFTDNESLAQIFKEIRVHGQSERYVHSRVGLGARMDTLQCAIVLAKLETFDFEVEQRSIIGARYNNIFDELGISRVVQREDRSSVFAQYTIFTDQRDLVREQLNHFGVPTAIHYPVPMNLQPAYRHLGEFSYLPEAEKVSKQVLSIPMGPYLQEDTQRLIGNCFAKMLSK